jgi:ribosome-associated toxin RatA of RatAB toxin-antitoxin module
MQFLPPRFASLRRRLMSWAGPAVCVITLPPLVANASATYRLCEDTPERLRTGRVAIIEQRPADGRGVALRACGMVDAPPGVVWDVLRDCGKFEQFLPRVSRSRATSRTDNIVVCDETIDMPFPLADLRSITRVVESTRPQGGFERRWSLMYGTYRRLKGAWVVLPADESASKSLVVYEVDMDPDTRIPDFLIRRAQSAAAPEVFRAVRERVRQCAIGPATTCRGE